MKLNYKKPIFAKCGKSECMLIPTIGNDYQLIGYDWYNLKKLSHQSCFHFNNKELAVQLYLNNGYDIYNGKIKIIKDGEK